MPVSKHRQIYGGFQHKNLPILSGATGAIINASNQSSFSPLSMYDGETLTPAGLVQITYNGGAGAYTIPTPVAGGPNPQAPGSTPVGTATDGDDGKELIILSTTAQAHVVTAALHKLRSNSATGNTLTFSTQGAFAYLIAAGGLWYVAQLAGVTLAGS